MSREYPFATATASFFLAGAAPGALPPGPPLLAYGANAAPDRLAAKLPGVPVAALAGVLRGYAVVHSRHVSPYGAVPATLVPAAEAGPGVRVFALLLGDRAAAALDVTEPNYERVLLRGLELEVELLGRVAAAEAYVSRHGPLLVDGAPVALGALPQERLRALVTGR